MSAILWLLVVLLLFSIAFNGYDAWYSKQIAKDRQAVNADHHYQGMKAADIKSYEVNKRLDEINGTLAEMRKTDKRVETLEQVIKAMKEDNSNVTADDVGEIVTEWLYGDTEVKGNAKD